MSLPASRRSLRWFARPLILAAAVPLMLLAGSGFLGVQYWQQRQAASLAVEHSRQVIDTLERLRAPFWTEWPSMRRLGQLDEQGGIRRHIKFFVNGDQAPDLAMPVGIADEVMIVCALSGG